jgi:tetratricopeptide (TPR) repeat protein
VAGQGEITAALDLEAQSVERARELADPWYLAMALNNYGYNRVFSGNVDGQTEQLLAESLRLRRDLDEKRGIGITLGSIAELQLLRGDLDAAATTVEEMLTLSETLTHAELTSTALNMQGFLHLARGNQSRAAEAFRDSLHHSYPRGFQLLAAEALLGLGEAAAQQGAFSRALRFEVVASQVINPAGQQPANFHQSAINRIKCHVEEALDQPAQLAIRATAQTATLDHVLAEAYADTGD